MIADTAYESKRRFFGVSRIVVAGTELSLDAIEHGLLRSSKWKYGLGYLPCPFPSTFERSHRLPEVVPRIHFALNCGAESCPPIAAYTASDIDSELDTSTQSFLQQSSMDDRNASEVWITRLFLYYRGDFGGVGSTSSSNSTTSSMTVIAPVYDTSSTTGRVTPECIGMIPRIDDRKRVTDLL